MTCQRSPIGEVLESHCSPARTANIGKKINAAAPAQRLHIPE
jgi:hypothetical protein